MHSLSLAVLPYLLLAVSLVLFLGLFFGIGRRLQHLRSHVVEGEARLQAEATQITNGMDSLRRRIEELETDPGTRAMASGMAHGMNSTTRAKVLKMHNLGQPIDKIADTMQFARGEVALLVKVHQIVMLPYQAADGHLSQVGQETLKMLKECSIQDTAEVTQP